jgi:uncharacterized protein
MKTENISLVEKAEMKEKGAANAPHLKHIIHELKHYLPAQAPLKDFIHHNTLHAFQKLKFPDALAHASEMFGYRVMLSLNEYRTLYDEQKISDKVIHHVIRKNKGSDLLKVWKQKMLSTEYRNRPLPRIGALRSCWKKNLGVDLDTLVHPTLFRVLCSYLDQGISIWNFPGIQKGFLASIRELERNSFTSFFRTETARELLLQKADLQTLLTKVVGNEAYFKQYVFDQQFAHQGWSGMVSAVEDSPETLLDRKKISLEDVITFELLLELDMLEYHRKKNWKPLSEAVTNKPENLFAKVETPEFFEVLYLWQLSFEWSYYDEVLAGIQSANGKKSVIATASFQAMFCLDDRECSFRRYLEKADPCCSTYGTPGFFNVEFYFKPGHGKFYTKLCPAPITPKYLIREEGSTHKRGKDLHFTKKTHSLLQGFLIAQTLGFLSAFRLFQNIFRPTATPATASSFTHMDHIASLTIENKNGAIENDLQVGFTILEMADRVEGLLRSIGLVKDFAPIVYIIGHGASSVNNPHYAAYDCGACSGRPGSVNARVICHMANHPEVRSLLHDRGIDIPLTTQFVGGLHDTTRDEIAFYDVSSLNPQNNVSHHHNNRVFERALMENARERSRRFDSVDTSSPLAKVHEEVKLRSVSLFETRPELNHATNSLCIVGRRDMTRSLFLDRRAFLNSYDYTVDREGKYLFNILKAAAPVCGGINLEYFFSRVDNQKLGAGTKLPHNVMGLFGVANGIEGDLRPGLPSQMIEVHDPLRLLIIVEHLPEVVDAVIRKHADTFEWFSNNWVHLAVVHPESRELFVFEDDVFVPYTPAAKKMSPCDLQSAIIHSSANLPATLIEAI